MGYVLLWIESLATSLLFVATLVAILAQLGLRQSRGLFRCFALVAAVVLALVPLAIYAAFAYLAAVLQFKNMANSARFPLLVLLAAAYALGALVVLIYGLRHQSEPARVRAGTWPRGRLAVALLAAVALHLMTLWNLDLAARQQLSALRTEAGALALSVAPPRLPDHDNAAIVYQQAFEAMGRNEASPNGWQWEKQWQDAWDERWGGTWQGSEKIGFDLHDPELRRFLKRQAGTLTLLRQAAAKPGCVFDRDYGRPSIEMLLPELGPMRNAARLLALEAICRAADKDYRGAMEDINAMFRMAEHLGTEPLLISQLVAVAIDGSAVDTLRHVLAFGPVPVEDLATIHMSNGISHRTRLRRAFRMEEAFSLAMFQQVGEGQIDIRVVGAISGSPELNAPFPNSSWFAPVYRVFLLGDDIAAQARFAAQFDRAVGLPYDRAQTVRQKIDLEMRNHAGGVLTKWLLPGVTALMEAVARGEARHDTARLGLALYVHRARKGKFPDTLEDLVPDFIPAVPRDPFDGRAMKLKLAGKRATVYSIGPDMTDNGGAPFDAEKKTGDITFTVQ